MSGTSFFKKKRFIVLLIITILLLITAYKLRRRPIDVVEWYLEKTYPQVTSKEADSLCQQLVKEEINLMKLVMYKAPYNQDKVQDYIKSGNCKILTTPFEEMGKQFHITDTSDLRKIINYAGALGFFNNDFEIFYLGFRDEWDKRNWFEKYFYFDFKRSFDYNWNTIFYKSYFQNIYMNYLEVFLQSQKRRK